MKPVVSLREITKDTVREICDLRPSEKQRSFIASNAVSIAHAHYLPDYAWFRAIYADETPVGFVLLGMEKEYCFLWRIMIDEKHQGKGYGKKALELIFDFLKSKGTNRVVTSYKPGEGDPRDFYKKLGFVEVDNKTLGNLGDEMTKYHESALQLII